MRPGPNTRRREAWSLTVSVGVHAALLAGFSWASLSEPEPTRERILEVAYLPAPRVPSTLAAEVLAPAAAPSTPANAVDPRPAPAEPEPGRASRMPAPRPEPREPPELRALPEATAPETEPMVECRVRIASLDITLPPRDPARPWLTIRVEPEAPAEDRLAPPRPRTLEQAAAALADAPSFHRATPRPPEPAPRARAHPFIPHAHAAEDGAETSTEALLALPLEGDPRLLDSIQARIDAVTPLVHATAWGCKHHRGTGRLRLLLNSRGYPRGYELVRSSGSACLDRRIEEVLHLGEPYPRASGWVPVYVRFEPGAAPPRPAQSAEGSSGGPSGPSSSRPATPQGML